MAGRRRRLRSFRPDNGARRNVARSLRGLAISGSRCIFLRRWMRLAVFRLGLFRVRQGLALVWAGRRSALGRQLSLSLRRSLLRLRCWLGDCDRRRWCFSHFFLRAPRAERQKDKAQGHDRLGSKWLHALLTESPAATRGCSPPAPLSESGSRRKKVVPCPSSEENSTLPWCNCTTR